MNIYFEIASQQKKERVTFVMQCSVITHIAVGMQFGRAKTAGSI